MLPFFAWWGGGGRYGERKWKIEVHVGSKRTSHALLSCTQSQVSGLSEGSWFHTPLPSLGPVRDPTLGEVCLKSWGVINRGVPGFSGESSVLAGNTRDLRPLSKVQRGSEDNHPLGLKPLNPGAWAELVSSEALPTTTMYRGNTKFWYPTLSLCHFVLYLS